jgi:DNA adenine methylase
MKKVSPLFIWAGGKTKVIKHYVNYLPSKVEEYSEPFFGGGAMFLYVMQRYFPQKIYINDIYDGITNIYSEVKNNVDSFCLIVDEYENKYLPLSKEDRKEYFYKVRHAHAFDYGQWDKTYEAATLYFLMKTGFNGILQINQNTNNRYGTPSGLLNQTTKIYDKENVYAWNHLLKNVEIHCGDYRNCPTGDFNFLDPPYRDSFTTYGTGWGDNETEDLLNHAKSLPGKVFLCNRDDGTSFFDDRLGDFNIIRFPITYTAGRRKKTDTGFQAKRAIEILLYN